MSLVFRLGYRDGAWVDKATGKTVYEKLDGSTSYITTCPGVFGVAPKFLVNSYYYGYLYSADSLDYAFGTGDFTMSVWAKPSLGCCDNGQRYLYQDHSAGTPILNFMYYAGGSNHYIQFNAGVYGGDYCSVYFHLSGDMTPNRWTHVELCRDYGGEDFMCFVDGVRITDREIVYTGTYTTGFSMPDCNGSIMIGLADNFSSPLDDLRIYKGECLHTTSFNPSYPGLLPGFQVL